MVYTAGSQALAALEMLVHLKSSDLLKPYRLIPVTFEQRLVLILEDDALPSNWKRRQAPAVVRALGDEWTQSLKSAVLRVPSVLVPGEYNYLLNPLHGDFARIRIGKPQHFRFDRRLK